ATSKPRDRATRLVALGVRTDQMHATVCAVRSMCRRLPSRAADTSEVAGGAPGSSTSTTSVHSCLMSCAMPTPRKPSKVLAAQADYTPGACQRARLRLTGATLPSTEWIAKASDPTAMKERQNRLTPRCGRKRLVSRVMSVEVV